MKTKLIKLLGFTPLLITPILGTSYIGTPHAHNTVNGNINGNNYLEYVYALASTLKATFNSDAFRTTVNSAVLGPSQIDITSYIAQAITEAKIAVTIIKLNPNIIDQIKLSFKTGNNLQLQKTDDKYILTAYPLYILSKSENSTINTSLTLQIGVSYFKQQIINTYVIPKGFKNYTTVTGLGSNEVRGVCLSPDGSTIYAATDGGVSIGTKDGVSYKFKNYTTAAGLGSDDVRGIFVSADGSKIYAATDGGVSIGTKDGDSYKFINYGVWFGLGSDDVRGIFASADGHRVYAATADGLSIGTRLISSLYVFANFTTSDDLGSNNIRGVYGSADGSKIYAATADGLAYGVATGPGGAQYTFKNEAIGISSFDDQNGVYVSPDGKTVYVAADAGILVGGPHTGTGSSFVLQENSLSSVVNNIFVSPDGKTVYAATVDGLSVGTYKSQYVYNNFKNYKEGLGSKDVYGVSVTSDSSFFAATAGGLSISKKVWNSPSITFNNKIIMNLRKDL